MAVHSHAVAAAGLAEGGGLWQAPGATAAAGDSGPTSGPRTLKAPRCLIYPRPGRGRDRWRGQAQGLTRSPIVYTNGRCSHGSTWSPGDRSVRGDAEQSRVLSLYTMTSRPRPSPSRACPVLCHTSGSVPHLPPLGVGGTPTAVTTGVSRRHSCPLGAELPLAEKLCSRERPCGSEPCPATSWPCKPGPGLGLSEPQCPRLQRADTATKSSAQGWGPMHEALARTSPSRCAPSDPRSFPLMVTNSGGGAGLWSHTHPGLSSTPITPQLGSHLPLCSVHLAARRGALPGPV